MDFAYYISKRIRTNKMTGFSGTIHSVAIASVAIGIAAMIISFLILSGFKSKIDQKIFSFGGHLQVTRFSFNSSYEEEPITRNNRLVQIAPQLDFIDRVQPYANKPGLIKANDEVMGVILKGVDQNFDFDRFSENMIDGRMLEFKDSAETRELIISKKISNLLQIHTDDDILIYFPFQDPVRVRKLKIVGIYETGMEDFDEKFVLSDLKMIQNLNNWPDSLVGGFEIFLKDFDDIDFAYDYLDENVLEPNLYIEKITDVFLEIFDWLKLLDKNVYLLIFFTLLVACINMTSILLILIMERTQMIGMLKALGCQNPVIRKIFIFNGMNLTIKGLVWGNVLGLALGALQFYTHVIKLDPENYYMNYVPIQWDWDIVIALNLLTFIIVNITLIVPTIIISNINPIKSIRFD